MSISKNKWDTSCFKRVYFLLKKIKPSVPKALFAHKNYLLAFDFKSAAPAAPHAVRERAIAI